MGRIVMRESLHGSGAICDEGAYPDYRLPGPPPFMLKILLRTLVNSRRHWTRFPGASRPMRGQM
jgi:hypothetical protein